MTRKEFRDFMEQKCKDMLDLFDRKNQEYGGDGSDVFHNFNDGYELATSNSPEEFAWDLRCKHLQSIRDQITKKNQFTKEQSDEKFGDDILYGFIIWGIVQGYYKPAENIIGGNFVPNSTVGGNMNAHFTQDNWKEDGLKPTPAHLYTPNPEYRLTVDELIKR